MTTPPPPKPLPPSARRPTRAQQRLMRRMTRKGPQCAVGLNPPMVGRMRRAGWIRCVWFPVVWDPRTHLDITPAGRAALREMEDDG